MIKMNRLSTSYFFTQIASTLCHDPISSKAVIKELLTQNQTKNQLYELDL